MSTHTKGPWRITRHNGLPDAIMAPDEALGWVGVAKIVILNDHEANARLLAAAPEMLAALEGFRLKEESIVGAQGGDMIVRIPMSVITAAAAAIANASPASPEPAQPLLKEGE